MEQKPSSNGKKAKRGKVKDISPYELLLRNSHELLWRKLSEYTIVHLGVVRVKVWFPELKLASNIKLDRCSSVDHVIGYIARKKKITSPHSGLFLERHGESGVWLENNTPLWLYDIQASDVLEYKPRPTYSSTVVSMRVFNVEQKTFKSTVFDKLLKISDLVSLFQVQFGLVKDSAYYGFNLLTPEANEIWLEDECLLSSYLVHNMSVVEYKKKPIIVIEPMQQHASVSKTCILNQSINVMDAACTISKWLKLPVARDLGLCWSQQNAWLEKDSQLGVHFFKPNDVIAIGPVTESPDSLLQRPDVCAKVIFAGPPGKNYAKTTRHPSLPGEVPVFKVTNVLHLSNFTSPSPASLSGGVVGDITISNYRLTFCALQSPEIDVEIPVAAIAKIEKKGKNKNEIFNGYFLDILCKDNRLIRFYWPQRDDSRKKLYHSLKMLTYPGDQHKLFAFFYEEEFSFDGWSILNLEAEYQRQKISQIWRVSLINTNYQMCDTYPPLLVVPAKITDDQLRAVFEFRSKGRIPVMTWQHPFNGTSISRCSQPLSGIRVTRCPEDEALIRELGYSSQPLIVDKLEKNLYVLDCRPKANAMGNRAKGAGYEDTTTCYPNCILEFLDIGNIHVMRESHEKLLDACLQAVGGAPGGGWSGSGPSDWLSAIASTKWLDHICTIFEATYRVIDCIHNQEVSVLLHCSDGWDRTAQVASLALLLLDPYYRTLRGFALLIEKEWLAFGHKFAQRHGFGDAKHLDERSPVFLQFLDCVWQMTLQFPNAFEFNEAFLLAILTHLHSCRFGTFLFNSHNERTLNSVRDKTRSLWSMLFSPPQVQEYVNLFYEPQDHVLVPNTSPRYFQLWHRAHLWWYMAIPPSIEVKVRQHAQNQAITIDKLNRQIEELKCLLDPSRPKNAETKSAIQLDSKLTSSEPGRGLFARNLRAALMSKRFPSGTQLNKSDPSASPQWEQTPIGHAHFTGNFGTSLGNMYGAVDLSSSVGSSLTSSVEITGSSLLRGDSPFGRFRTESSAYSSDDSDDDDDLSSTISLHDSGSLTSSSEQNPNHTSNQNTNHNINNQNHQNNQNNQNQYNTQNQHNTNMSANGAIHARSPSIGSRRYLDVPTSLTRSPSISHENATQFNAAAYGAAQRPASPLDNAVQHNASAHGAVQYKPASPQHSPTISTTTTSPTRPTAGSFRVASPSSAPLSSSSSTSFPSTLSKSSSSSPISPSTSSSSSSSSSSFVAGKISRPPVKTISSPHISINQDFSTGAKSPRNASAPDLPSPFPVATSTSPRAALRSAMIIPRPAIELAMIEEPIAPTPNNTHVATYIATVSSGATSPRTRGPTAAFTNAAGVSNVANYISHNYTLSDSAKLAPRATSPSLTSPVSSLNSSSSSSSSSPSPSTPTTPENGSPEETKWQQVRRTPSSRSLHFLDQSKRYLPPASNPMRFSTS